MSAPGPAIDLSTPLSLRSAFGFPLQSPAARMDVVIGAVLLLLVPVVGWILNLGHRVVVVHRLQNGQPPWPAWNRFGQLFKHGLITLGGMIFYYLPALALGGFAWSRESTALATATAVLAAGATLAIPGFMSHYCRAYDPAEIYNPVRALHRCWQGGALYWRAWGIALCALLLSFAGLLGLGVGFVLASVWFWQVAGFSFACAFTRRFGLAAPPPR